MNILAFETSCDETAVAIVKDGREIIANEILSQSDTHAIYGGVVPEIASRQHIRAIGPLLQRALGALPQGETIDAVAVTSAPGLIGALLVGVNFAKSYAFAKGLPLIPVHHIRGHVASAYLSSPGLRPPFLALVASGGHTQILHVKDYTDMEVAARSRDDAAGEAFDKAARVLGLGYPGGPAIARHAEGGDDRKYPLPMATVRGSEYDMSFSGLKTALQNLYHNAGQRGEALDTRSLAASFERAVCESLAPRLRAVSEALGVREVVLAGGVAANQKLRALLTNIFGGHAHIPPVYLCGDNAAMIAAQAFYEDRAGVRGGTALNGNATVPANADWKSLCQQ